MSDKSQIITSLRGEFNAWEILLANMSEAEMITPRLDEDWSIKDVMAHLWVWQQRSVARIEAARLNREPVFPDWPTQFDPEAAGQPHDLNDWLYQNNREKSWAQVYGDWRTGFLRLLELAEAIPHDALLTVGHYAWLEDYPLSFILDASREHHEEHREWLTERLDQDTS